MSFFQWSKKCPSWDFNPWRSLSLNRPTIRYSGQIRLIQPAYRFLAKTCGLLPKTTQHNKLQI